MRLGLGRVSLHADRVPVLDYEVQETYVEAALGLIYMAWNENPDWVRWYEVSLRLIWVELRVVVRGRAWA